MNIIEIAILGLCVINCMQGFAIILIAKRLKELRKYLSSIGCDVDDCSNRLRFLVRIKIDETDAAAKFTDAKKGGPL